MVVLLRGVLCWTPVAGRVSSPVPLAFCGFPRAMHAAPPRGGGPDPRRCRREPLPVEARASMRARRPSRRAGVGRPGSRPIDPQLGRTSTCQRWIPCLQGCDLGAQALDLLLDGGGRRLAVAQGHHRRHCSLAADRHEPARAPGRRVDRQHGSMERFEGNVRCPSAPMPGGRRRRPHAAPRPSTWPLEPPRGAPPAASCPRSSPEPWRRCIGRDMRAASACIQCSRSGGWGMEMGCRRGSKTHALFHAVGGDFGTPSAKNCRSSLCARAPVYSSSRR